MSASTPSLPKPKRPEAPLTQPPVPPLNGNDPTASSEVNHELLASNCEGFPPLPVAPRSETASTPIRPADLFILSDAPSLQGTPPVTSPTVMYPVDRPVPLSSGYCPAPQLGPLDTRTDRLSPMSNGSITQRPTPASPPADRIMPLPNGYCPAPQHGPLDISNARSTPLSNGYLVRLTNKTPVQIESGSATDHEICSPPRVPPPGPLDISSERATPCPTVIW